MTRHRLDLFSLLSGALLVLLATLALFDGFTLGIARWLWPTVLIGTGAVVLVAAIGRGRATMPAVDGATAEEPLPHHHEMIEEARQEVEDADVTTD